MQVPRLPTRTLVLCFRHILFRHRIYHHQPVGSRYIAISTMKLVKNLVTISAIPFAIDPVTNFNKIMQRPSVFTIPEFMHRVCMNRASADLLIESHDGRKSTTERRSVDACFCFQVNAL